ncbi:MAG: Bug family tripartite tricarboxylate transporter substrate binding protein, partial [Burkholderiales bacterium]
RRKTRPVYTKFGTPSLVGKHLDSTVNNPIEAVAQWRAGQLRALCVFDEKRMAYKAKVTDTQSWADIPTCKEAGVPTDYTMLRGIFMAPGVSKDQLDFYTGLLKKIRETPEWKDYMEKGAFNQTSMSGEDFNKWLGTAEQRHRELMKEAGFIAK